MLQCSTVPLYIPVFDFIEIYVWPKGDEYLNAGQPSLPQYDQEALAHYNEYYSRYRFSYARAGKQGCGTPGSGSVTFRRIRFKNGHLLMITHSKGA